MEMQEDGLISTLETYPLVDKVVLVDDTLLKRGTVVFSELCSV